METHKKIPEYIYANTRWAACDTLTRNSKDELHHILHVFKPFNNLLAPAPVKPSPSEVWTTAAKPGKTNWELFSRAGDLQCTAGCSAAQQEQLNDSGVCLCVWMDGYKWLAACIYRKSWREEGISPCLSLVAAEGRVPAACAPHWLRSYLDHHHLKTSPPSTDVERRDSEQCGLPAPSDPGVLVPHHRIQNSRITIAQHSGHY